MKINTAVIKLTFFYVLMLMIISLGFSFSIYKISSNEIGRGLGRQGQILRGLGQKLNSDQMDDFENLRRRQISESLNRLKLNLIYFNLLIFLFSTIGSYFFARWTLHPLERAMEEQNRFTADASHELRTPLTAFRSEIEVALRDKNFDIKDARKLLNSNLEEIGKLEILSSALLKLAKFDETNKLDFSTLNLDEIISEAFEKIENIANKKNIKIEAKLVRAKILGDKTSLTELFVILFDNAIKYSPSGSKVKVKLSLNGNHSEVSVKDQGVGIKLSDLPHIFDRFYRADQSRNKEKADGYGLGLSIAKRIVELHQGKIFVKSFPGKGSEFIVSLS